MKSSLDQATLPGLPPGTWHSVPGILVEGPIQASLRKVEGTLKLYEPVLQRLTQDRVMTRIACPAYDYFHLKDSGRK